MTDHLPFTADGFEMKWATASGDDVEIVAAKWDNEAWTVNVHLTAERVDVVMRLSPLWHVRQMMVFRDLDQPDLWLGTDGHGRWGEMNGAHRPELDGALDVTVAGTAFPHVIPIRRLPLLVGDSARINVLEVDVETLGVVSATHTYRRLAQRRWIDVTERHTVEFEVDEHGVPIDIGERVRQTVAR